MQSHAGEISCQQVSATISKKTVFGSVASIKICSIRNYDFNKEEEPFGQKKRKKKENEEIDK